MVKKADGPVQITREIAKRKKLPYATGSVAEAELRHVLQYLTPKERVNLVNELWRVLKPDGRAQLFVPSWSSNRAYADLDVVWPPVVEGWLAGLSKAQRDPAWTQYKCDFSVGIGYGLHPLVGPRNQEYQQNAITFWKEAAQEIVATLTKG